MRFIITGIISLLLLSCESATYYISTAGNDSTGDGSTGNRWRTIQKGANSSVAGDTVLVGDGYYAEWVSLTNASGSSGSRITIQAENSFLATNSGFYCKKPYWTIRGFIATGATPGSRFFAFEAGDGGDDFQVISNRITETTDSCGAAGIWGTHLTNMPARMWIEGNSFVDCNRYHIGLNGYAGGHTFTNNFMANTKGWDAIYANSVNCTIVANVFTNFTDTYATNSNHQDIVQGFSSSGNLSRSNVFERNLVVNCGEAQMGQFEDQALDGSMSRWVFRNNVWDRCYSSMKIYGYGFKFYNNTLIRSGTSTGSPFSFLHDASKGSADEGEVYNNIFIDCDNNSGGTTGTGGGWYFETGVTNGFHNYNLACATNFAAITFTDSTEANGLNGVSPQFVGFSSGDFRIQSGSPCVGAATNLSSLFSDDFTGTTRSVPWDIGAYELSDGGGGGEVSENGLSITTGTLTITGGLQ